MDERLDDVPLDDIVYLDQNFSTYKYFLTGQFSSEERKAEQAKSSER